MYTIYTERHKLHTTDNVTLEGAPFVIEEVPARAEVILRAVQTANLGPVVAPTEHGLDPILAVHDAGFVEFLRTAYEWSAGFYGKAEPVFPWTFSTRHVGRRPKHLVGLTGYYAFGFGSPILEGTWEAAYWSAQCALTAADLLLAGERVAYALCRPPGHHAAADLYGGFCYLNNAAIAARYLQAVRSDGFSRPATRVATTNESVRSDGFSRPAKVATTNESVRSDGFSHPAKVATTAILDIDYHHGNGTQAIFYADPTVLYCSLHAHPDDDYPYYWGEASERGTGAGAGLNRNWPLPQGTDDARYLTALDEALAAIQEFVPRYLVVSAGFDIVAGDPVGGFSVTHEGLREVGRRIADLGLPTLIVQEGGYRLESLGESAVAFLGALA